MYFPFLFKINSNLPYISNFQDRQYSVISKPYTAEEDCFVFVITVTDGSIYQTITTAVNTFYVRQYQNTKDQIDIADGFLVALKKGDTISVAGTEKYSFHIYQSDEEISF